MINEEEKFDNLLRDKMSERDFFFDELNWSEANDLIERNEKKIKLKRFSAVLAGGIAIGVLITVPVMSLLNSARNEKTIASSHIETSVNPSENNQQPVTVNNTPKPATASENKTLVQNTTGQVASSPSVVANNNITANASKDITASLPASEVIAHNSAPSEKALTHPNNILAAANKKSEPIVSKGQSQNAPVTEASAKATPGKAAASNTPEPETASVSANQGTTTNKNNNSQSASPAVQASTNGIDNIADKGTSVSTQGTTSNAPAAKEPLTNTAAIQTPGSTANNNASNNTTPTSAPAEASSTPTVQAPTAKTDATTNKNTDAGSVAKETSGDASKKDATATPDNTTAKSPDTITHGGESILSAMALPSIKPATSYIKGFNLLSIDAGGGYSFGWSNTEASEGNGISPVIGVSAAHFFSTRISLAVGVQYNSLANLKSSYSNSATSYDFGYNNTTTTVTPTTVYYLAVPLTLQYHINDNNAIGIGASASFLVNTSSTVVKSTQDDLNAPTNQSSSTLGYTTGFNNIDLQARIAYRRRIYKSFSVTAEGYYGFMDIENNSFFSDNTFQRNSGIRLIFSYDLIK